MTALTRLPLVALSGWAHGTDSMAGLLGSLAVQECGCYDLGQLAAAAGAAPGSRYASGLLGIMEEAGAPVVLMGWSTGGIVALEAARLRPDRVGGLVLLGACSRYCNGDDFRCGVPEKNLRALMLGLRRRPEDTLKGFLRDCAHPAVPAEGDLQADTGAALGLGIDELGRGLEYLRDIDVRAGLSDLRVPSLVLHGEADRIVPPEAGRYLAQSLPDAYFHSLPAAGHSFPVQDAKGVAGRIDSFLEEPWCSHSTP